MQENRTFPLRAWILVLVSALAIAVGSVTTAHASYFGDAAQGYDQGKQNAINDWNNGNRTPDYTCPSGVSTTYCTGYVAGYTVGWNSEQNLQP